MVAQEPSYGHYPLHPRAVASPPPAAISGREIIRTVFAMDSSKQSPQAPSDVPHRMGWQVKLELIADLARGAESTCPSNGPRMKIGRLCGVIDTFMKTHENGEQPIPDILDRMGWSVGLQLIADLTEGAESSCPEGPFRIKVGRLRRVLDSYIQTYPHRR